MILITVWRLFVFLLLLYAYQSDKKTGKVSNKVILGICLLSIPLIFMNIPNITNVHIIVIISLLLLYYVPKMTMIGGADIKALIPIILSITLGEFIVAYIAAMICSVGMFAVYRTKTIPFFIPITVGYLTLFV